MPSDGTKKDRDQELKEYYEKQMAKYDELEEHFELALGVIEKKIAHFYRRYAGPDGKIPRARAHEYNRLRRLQSEIQTELQDLWQKMAESPLGYVETTYRKSFHREAFRIENEIREDYEAQLHFGVLPQKQVRQSVHLSLENVTTWKEYNDRNIEKLIKDTRDAITRGILHGSDYSEVARDVRDNFQKGFNQAIRVIRTEGHRARQAGRAEAQAQAEQQGVQLVKVWIATPDDRTRIEHGMADQQRRPLDEPFIVGGEELMHPGDPTGSAENVINCRCELGDHIEGFEPKFRRERLTDVEYQARLEEEKRQAAEEGRDPRPIPRTEVVPFRNWEQYAHAKGLPVIEGFQTLAPIEGEQVILDQQLLSSPLMGEMNQVSYTHDGKHVEIMVDHFEEVTMPDGSVVKQFAGHSTVSGLLEGGELYVTRLFVDERYQGAGIGESLIAEIGYQTQHRISTENITLNPAAQGFLDSLAARGIAERVGNDYFIDPHKPFEKYVYELNWIEDKFWGEPDLLDQVRDDDELYKYFYMAADHKPVNSVPDFQSREEIREWLDDHSNHNFSKPVYLTGDFITDKHIVFEMARFKEAFPQVELSGRFRVEHRLVTDRGDPFGWYNQRVGNTFLNANYWIDDPRALVRDYQHGVVNGLFPKGTNPLSTVGHEFAHALDLQHKRHGFDRVQIIEQAIKNVFPWLALWDKLEPDDMLPYIQLYISDYAMMNSAETFAEAIAMSLASHESSELADEILKLTQDWMGEYYKDKRYSQMQFSF